MMDDKVYNRHHINDGVLSQEESQHPSIVNSVTNDEDDCDYGELQQQYDQDDPRHGQERRPQPPHYHHYYEQQRFGRYELGPPYRLSSSAPASQILPPPLPRSKNNDDLDRHLQQLNRSVISDTTNLSTTLPLLNSQKGHQTNSAGTNGIAARTTQQHSKQTLHPTSYLIRYEHMMKAQQTEKMATLSHVQPIFDVLEEMIGQVVENDERKLIDSLDGKYSVDDDLLMDSSARLSKEVRVHDLRKVLMYIESASLLSSSSSSSTTKVTAWSNEDEVATLNVSSIDLDLILMDSQMMTVLRTICKSSTNSDKVDCDIFISWAEILQLYRLCIVGMQTLEILSASPTIRERAKGRTLNILSLFDHGPNQNDQARDDRHTTNTTVEYLSKPITDFNRNSLAAIMSRSDLDNDPCSLSPHASAIKCISGTKDFNDKNPKPLSLWQMSGWVLLGLLIIVSASCEMFTMNSSVADFALHDEQGSGTPDEFQYLKQVHFEADRVQIRIDPLVGATASKVFPPSQVGRLKSSMVTTAPMMRYPSVLVETSNAVKKHRMSDRIAKTKMSQTQNAFDIEANRSANKDSVTEMLSKVGGIATILYLSLPLLASGAGWAPLAALMAVSTFGGRAIGRWLATNKWHTFFPKWWTK